MVQCHYYQFHQETVTLKHIMHPNAMLYETYLAIYLLRFSSQNLSLPCESHLIFSQFILFIQKVGITVSSCLFTSLLTTQCSECVNKTSLKIHTIHTCVNIHNILRLWGAVRIYAVLLYHTAFPYDI